jgi:TrpR-related protein YerC/YecD
MQKKDQADLLYKAILCLETEEECKAFFQDLCTFTEVKAMAQRMEVARLLDQGLIYNEILERTGTSSATISRINRALQYGSDGYRIVLDRLEK